MARSAHFCVARSFPALGFFARSLLMDTPLEPHAHASRRAFLAVAAVGFAASVLASCKAQQGARTASGGPIGGPAVGGTGSVAGSGASAGGSGAVPGDGSQPPVAKPPTEKHIDRPAPPKNEPAVRVKVGSVVRGKGLEVGIPGQVLVVSTAALGVQLCRVQAPALLTRDDAGWSIAPRSGSSKRVRIDGSDELIVATAGATAEEFRVLGGVWPGALHLVVTPQGADVVAHVALETYLAGVVAKELYNSWSLEAHRAQAVAARSYAICEQARWAHRRHFDVHASEASQAWVGKTEHAKSLEAVASTRGQVLVFEGTVVPAYFSSCCGGARADAEGTIASDLRHDIAPLSAVGAPRGCACVSFSPHANWTAKLPLQGVSQTLCAWGPVEGFRELGSFASVRAIEVVGRNAAGRNQRMRVDAESGLACELPAERVRWALSADPINPRISKPFKERVKSAYFDPRVVGSALVLDGHGFGHGVGMCQFGAEGASRNGKHARAILAHSYPGASVAVSYT